MGLNTLHRNTSGRTCGHQGASEHGKPFIYYYHDGPNPEEVNDPFSGMPFPKKGEVIEPEGKNMR
jgi:hypothetical protein